MSILFLTLRAVPTCKEMAVKEPTQKNKLKLAAREIPFSDDHAGQYYLQPRVQKCLTLEDIAAEVAALSARQEDAEDVGRILRQAVRHIMWFVSSGYSVSTELGSFRLTAQGVFAQGELGGVPDRDRLRLGVSYTMSEAMRDLLDQVEIDVEIQPSDSQPRICGVVSTEDLQRPAEALRDGRTPLLPGRPCILKCRGAKVGGPGADVTLTRVDDGSGASFFFPPEQLYPNTLTKVGFILPADMPAGSVWTVKLCTYIGMNGSLRLKNPRITTLESALTIGD